MSNEVVSITGDGRVASTPKGGDGPHYNDDNILLDDSSEDVAVEEVEDEDDDKQVEVKRSNKEIEDEDDKEDEEQEDEEITEEDDKKPDIPFDRPTIKEIRTKYPEFFKDFPQMKESFFREIEFTKLFPTVDDAKEAFDENESFTILSDAVLSGNPEPLLDSVEKTDKKALELFSMSFLPSLYKKNQDLYYETVTPLFQNLVRNIYKSSGKDSNEQNAAIVIANYLFGDELGEDVASGKKSVAKALQLTDEQKKLKDTKEQNLTQSFRNSVGNVDTKITNSLEAIILKSNSFDPEKVFSPFLRKQGAQEVIKRIKKSLESDTGHMKVMSARWKRARANGYTSDDESKIVSTYLARAKSLIPDACSKVAAAMLGTKKQAAQNKQARVERSSETRRENNSGLAGGSRNGSSTKVDYSKMTDMDILSS